MKKSIKTILLGMATAALLTGCFGQGSTSSNDSTVTSNNSSSSVTSDSTITSSSTSTSTTQSSVVVKTQITVTAPKTTLEINEEVLISTNVQGVTLTTTEGATITNGVFKATKAGSYVVTAHKDGDFIDGTLTITVLTAKTDIVLSTDKVNVDINEPVTITSSVEGVTFSTTEGASIEDGVFTATKEGTYVVTATKEGRYNEGTLTINVKFVKTLDKVKNTLKALKTSQNYTLNGTSQVGDYQMYRTPNYFFDSQLQEGMALFTNIIPNTEFDKVAHYIKMVDGNLIIGNDVVYLVDGEGTIATDLYDIDLLQFIDIDSVIFEEDEGYFVTTNELLVGSYAGLLNSNIAAYASAVQYTFNEKFELVANLLFADTEGAIDYTSAEMFGDLTYTNIGQTVAPVVDEEYKKVTVAEESMSEEVSSSFMLKQGHIKATIKIITGNEEKLLGTSEYNFDEKYLIEDKYITGSNKTIHNFYQNKEGDAEYVGIGPDNKVVTSSYGEWESFTFPFATLDTTQFRQTGEHTYSYLGHDANVVASNLAWASIGDNEIAYITAQEENGKIVSFTCETANTLVDISPIDSEEPIFANYKVVIEVEVLPYETIADPKPYEADADTVRIQAYLDEIMGENANYQMFLGDYLNTSNWKNIKVTNGTILVQEYKNSATTYHGYHKLSDGSIIKFSATSANGEVSAKFEGDVELEEGKPFASLLGLNISAEAMSFDEDGNIVFKNEVLYGGTGLYNEFNENRYAIDGTIKFTVASGHISGITYKYADAEKATEYASLYTGSFGTTALTSTFETKLLEILPTLKEAPKPTSWAEELPEFYNNIVSMVGEQNVALIPYIYDINYSGKFVVGSNSATLKSVKLTSGTYFEEEYRLAISAACVEAGFTQNGSNKYSCYIILGDMKLTVGTTGSMFTVMYKAA